MEKEGFSKLKGFCNEAAQNGFDWVWMDNCCIDKSSSAELSVAINSMFKYYQDAVVCYVYPFDLEKMQDLTTISEPQLLDVDGSQEGGRCKNF